MFVIIVWLFRDSKFALESSQEYWIPITTFLNLSRGLKIPQKGAARIGYNGFLLPLSYSPSTCTEKYTRYIQYGPRILFQ